MPNRTPANLRDLLEGDQTGYTLVRGYFAELDHTLMGFFPAIFRGTVRRIVITLDPRLLNRVLATLPPRRFKIGFNLFYVNRELGIGFPMLENQEDSRPQTLLFDPEFDKLMTKEPHPFEWAPGLISDDMSEEDFRRTLEAAAEQHGVKLTTSR